MKTVATIAERKALNPPPRSCQLNSDGSWTCFFDDDLIPTPIRTLDQAVAEKLAVLKDLRFEVETRGITVGGMAIKTDLESQNKINGAWTAVQINPYRRIDFKA